MNMYNEAGLWYQSPIYDTSIKNKKDPARVDMADN